MSTILSFPILDKPVALYIKTRKSCIIYGELFSFKADVSVDLPRGLHVGILYKKLKERYHQEDTDVKRRIIFKWILEK
jgi:hypothetical protein